MRKLALLGLALAAIQTALASARSPAGSPPVHPAETSPPGARKPADFHDRSQGGARAAIDPGARHHEPDDNSPRPPADGPSTAPGPEAPDDDEAEGPIGGEIQSEGIRTEILPEPPPVGQRIDLPEGWYSIESAPARDTRGTGSLSIVSRPLFAAQEPAPPGPRGATAPGPAPVTEEAAPSAGIVIERGRDPCREQKDRYVTRLLESLAITDIDHPLSLLEGIEELPAGVGTGSSPRLWSLGLPAAGPGSIDPLRPLAWDLELRSIARDLATCIHDRATRR